MKDKGVAGNEDLHCAASNVWGIQIVFIKGGGGEIRIFQYQIWGTTEACTMSNIVYVNDNQSTIV